MQTVTSNTTQQINSALFALDKSIKELNTAINVIEKALKENDATLLEKINEKVNKADVVDAVTDGDLNPVTSNAVYDGLSEKVNTSDVVDIVQVGNSNPVTSNAVSSAISGMSASQVGGSGQYIESISQTNGQVSASAQSIADSVASGNNYPVTSNAVASALSGKVNTSDVVDRIEVNNSNPVTSNAVSQAITNIKNGIVMENLDLDSYTECGLYVTKNDESYTNVPEGMNNRYFSLMVVATAKYLQPEHEIDYPFRNQILYKYHDSEIYTRTYSWREQGLAWGEWRKVVFQDELGIKETEKRIGTWIDGSPLFEKAILFNVPQNGDYAIPINVTNLKNVVNWRGNFFQNGYQNPSFIMHIPYTYFDKNNLADMINIYTYYNPPASEFQCSFYGSGMYASSYFSGQGILYFQYTKNS